MAAPAERRSMLAANMFETPKAKPALYGLKVGDNGRYHGYQECNLGMQEVCRLEVLI
jgi:hypothetical protein